MGKARTKEPGKPAGKTSSYAYFVKTCREEHRKKNPKDVVEFTKFSQKCAEKWKDMTPKEKARFDGMAQKDKERYNKEMEVWDRDHPNSAKAGGKRKKADKDPNMPKRALSAFFMYCAERRPVVKKANPGFSVGDIAKELGKEWREVTDKSKYEAQAEKDKERYRKAMDAYNATQGSPPKKQKKAAAPPPVEASESSEEEDDDESEEESD
jgi:hypothetical protein